MRVILCAIGCQAALSADLPPPVAVPSLQQQVAALQSQVAALQAQLTALTAAVQVSANGVVLQGPAVLITAGRITMQSQSDINLSSATFSAQVQHAASLQSGDNLVLQSAAAAKLGAGTTLELNAKIGATIETGRALLIKSAATRFNGGGRPLATVGSVVQVQTSAGLVSGQVVSGSKDLSSD
jgi:hypothetical protein